MKRPNDTVRLMLPLSRTEVLAGYLSDVYKAYFGRDNYGLDLTDHTDPCIYAGGRGVVLATGQDSSLGGTVIVRYNNVWNHKTERAMDLVIRYNHMLAITTAAGRPVVAGDLLGLMGCTAAGERGIFLHVEVDTDLSHPTRTPSLISESTFLHPGNRLEPTTIDPVEIFYIGTGQSLGILQPDWCQPDAFALPVIDPHEPGSSLSVFEKFESALRATESHLAKEASEETR